MKKIKYGLKKKNKEIWSPTFGKVVFHTLTSTAPKRLDIELTNMEVQAGDQTSTPIRNLARLASTYSEYDPKYWQKKSGTAYGENFHYVIHWYENQGYAPIGEMKLKGMKENR